MFNTRKDMLDRIAQLETELAQSESDLVEARAESSALAENLSNTKAELEIETEARKEAESTLEAIADENEAAKAKLESFDDEVDKAAKVKSDAFLETLGHSPLALEPSTGDPSTSDGEDILAREAKITDPAELARFHKEHALEIQSALYH